MFPELRVLRHRLFETNFPIYCPPHRRHPLVHTHDRRKAHYGRTNEWVDYVQVTGGGNCTIAAASDAMGIDWMIKREEHAKRLLPGGSGLPASDARRFVEADPELAEALLQEDGVYSYMNQYSAGAGDDVNPYHAESLLDITDDGIFPTVGGRMDELRARRDASIVCELEMHILAALGNQLSTDSSEALQVVGRSPAIRRVRQPMVQPGGRELGGAERAHEAEEFSGARLKNSAGSTRPLA